MNQEQIKAVREAIGVEEDWLLRAEIEQKRSGEPDIRMDYHRRKLAALKEGID